MKKQIKHLIKKILVSLIKAVLPKGHNIIIFESADLFFDNSYVLYLYIKNNYRNKRLFYICRTEKQYFFRKAKSIERKDILKIYKSKSKFVTFFRKLYIEAVFSKSSLVFCSYLVDDFKNVDNVKDQRKIVMLWHGTLGFKSGKEIYQYHFKTPNNYFYCSPTKLTKQILDRDSPILCNTKHVICGKPRNDMIYHPQEKKLATLLGLNDIKQYHIIMVCCTFRTFQSTTDDFFKDEFPLSLSDNQLQSLNNQLVQLNKLLLIKTHHAQRNVNMGSIVNKYSNIKIQTINDFEKINLSIYEIMSLTDALITDYSSIYFDYLLVNKPIAIIQPVDDAYQQNHKKLNLLPIQIQNKNVIRNYNDFCNFILYFKDTEQDCKDRFQLSKQVNGDYHNNNCKSICDFFIND